MFFVKARSCAFLLLFANQLQYIVADVLEIQVQTEELRAGFLLTISFQVYHRHQARGGLTDFFVFLGCFQLTVELLFCIKDLLFQGN